MSHTNSRDTPRPPHHPWNMRSDLQPRGTVVSGLLSPTAQPAGIGADNHVDPLAGGRMYSRADRWEPGPVRRAFANPRPIRILIACSSPRPQKYRPRKIRVRDSGQPPDLWLRPARLARPLFTPVVAHLPGTRCLVPRGRSELAVLTSRARCLAGVSRPGVRARRSVPCRCSPLPMLAVWASHFVARIAVVLLAARRQRLKKHFRLVVRFGGCRAKAAWSMPLRDYFGDWESGRDALDCREFWRGQTTDRPKSFCFGEAPSWRSRLGLGISRGLARSSI